MRLAELGVGSWFRSPWWSLNTVAVLVEERRGEHGAVRLRVHRVIDPEIGQPSHTATRERFATWKEMAFEEWYAVERPRWVVVPGGSDGS